MPALRLALIDPDTGAPSGPAYDAAKPGTFILGRDPASTWVVDDDPVVSRKHYMIVLDPPRAALHDLGSRNGVRINEVLYGGKSGRREADGSVPPVPLSPGDRVRVGRTILELQDLSEPDPDGTVLVAGKSSTPAAAAPAPAVGNRQAFPAGGVAGMIAGVTKGERPPPAIAGYTMGRILGKGGMGAVYHAIREADGMEVAIKVMLMGGLANEKMLGRFQREIAISRTLKHENIVACHEDGAVGDQFYLVLEYIAHGCLARRLHKRGPMTPAEAMPHMRQMLAGLAFAHERQFVHRDLKPANVLLGGADGDVAKLTDFGLAKNFVEAGLSGFTTTGTAAGTVTCLPPEQLTNFRHVLPSADVFAIAATFYEMMTGRSPYNVGPGTDAMGAVLNFNLTPLAVLKPEFPAPLTAFIDRALSREAEDRFADAGAMLAAYDELPPIE